MEDYRYLNELRDIEPQNEFLRYISDRVVSDDYRGIQCSQHNRLTFDYFKAVVDAIYAVAGEERFFIHIGDDHGARQPLAAKYYEVVEEIKRRAGRGTVNSVKKNTFPDIARMGFLERFGKNKSKPFSEAGRHAVHSVRLSALGLKFAQATARFEQVCLFTAGVDRLLHSAATELADFLDLNDYGVAGIDILEYMYILSDDRAGVSFGDKLRLLLSYRELLPHQQEEVHALLRKYCNPANRRDFDNKTLMRDYHNWKNEAQQIYCLFSFTAYFRVVNGTLTLNTGDLGFFDPNVKRGARGKTEYFSQHGVEKRAGYELHHIVPFFKARNKQEALLVDDFKNLIYLNETKHAMFTNAHNRHAILGCSADGSQLFFRDENDDSIIAVEPGTDALLSTALLPQMREYNKMLLKKYRYRGF